MGDPRYHAGVVQGIALSRHHGLFPEKVPGLGPMRGAQPGGCCSFCAAGTHPQFSFTWVTYGDRHVCGRCARLLVSESGDEVRIMIARSLGQTEVLEGAARDE